MASHAEPSVGHVGHGDQGAHAHDPARLHDHHVTPPATFLKVLGVLLFLTFVTVYITRFDFGSLNMPLAMFVAAVKASLVLTFFMHLKYDTAINNIVIISSFIFLALLFLFLLADLSTRGDSDPRIAEPAPVWTKDGQLIVPVWKPAEGGPPAK